VRALRPGAKGKKSRIIIIYSFDGIVTLHTFDAKVLTLFSKWLEYSSLPLRRFNLRKGSGYDRLRQTEREEILAKVVDTEM
jgi:hypothetical protein